MASNGEVIYADCFQAFRNRLQHPADDVSSRAATPVRRGDDRRVRAAAPGSLGGEWIEGPASRVAVRHRRAALCGAAGPVGAANLRRPHALPDQ